MTPLALVQRRRSAWSRSRISFMPREKRRCGHQHDDLLDQRGDDHLLHRVVPLVGSIVIVQRPRSGSGPSGHSNRVYRRAGAPPPECRPTVSSRVELTVPPQHGRPLLRAVQKTDAAPERGRRQTAVHRRSLGAVLTSSAPLPARTSEPASACRQSTRVGSDGSDGQSARGRLPTHRTVVPVRSANAPAV